LHVTEQIGLILEFAPGDPERQRALKEALQKHMQWRSAGTVQYYDHALSTSEAHQLLHEAFVIELTAQPRDRAELQATLRGDADASVYSAQAAERLRRLSALVAES